MPDLKPYTQRDFHKGRYTPASINTYLAPVNSVSESLNVNYDTIIGSGVVRLGTTKLGNTVASGRTPLGLTEFVNPELPDPESLYGTPSPMIP